MPKLLLAPRRSLLTSAPTLPELNLKSGYSPEAFSNGIGTPASRAAVNTSVSISLVLLSTHWATVSITVSVDEQPLLLADVCIYGRPSKTRFCDRLLAGRLL